MDTVSVEEIMADYPEVMGVWPNPTLATVIALCRDQREAMRAQCEALARLHTTYGLPDFPPAFNGGYRERRSKSPKTSPRSRTSHEPVREAQ